MEKSRRILALIPARGGSKGLPRKNIRVFGGKPLIAWTIEEALKSGCFTEVAVSTDDQEIAAVAGDYGARVPFLRPGELAMDKTRGIEVVLHAMDWFEENEQAFDLLMLLQPTSPLRTAEDIKTALAVFAEKQAEAVVSVCACEYPPVWANTIGPDLCMKDFVKKEALQNRQKLGTFYRLNGAVYLAGWDFLRRNRGFFGERTFAYIMPAHRSVDIDSELDLQFAEFLLARANQFLQRSDCENKNKASE